MHCGLIKIHSNKVQFSATEKDLSFFYVKQKYILICIAEFRMTDSEIDLIEIMMRMVGTRRGGFVRRKGAGEGWEG